MPGAFVKVEQRFEPFVEWLDRGGSASKPSSSDGRLEELASLFASVTALASIVSVPRGSPSSTTATNPALTTSWPSTAPTGPATPSSPRIAAISGSITGSPEAAKNRCPAALGLVIAATWGEGDPPARAVDFYQALMSDAAPRLASK